MGFLDALLFTLGADIIQIRQKAGDMVWVDGTIAVLVFVCEGIEGNRGSAGVIAGLILGGEGVEGYGRSALFVFVRKGVESHGGGGGAIIQGGIV